MQRMQCGLKNILRSTYEQKYNPAFCATISLELRVQTNPVLHMSAYLVTLVGAITETLYH